MSEQCIQQPERFSDLNGGLRQTEIQDGTRAEAGISPDLSKALPDNIEAPYPADIDNVLDMTSLAMRVANNDDAADDTDEIPSPDLGEPFDVWRTFWQTREQEPRPPSSLRRRQTQGRSRRSQEAREKKKECTERRIPTVVDDQPITSRTSSSEYRPKESQHLQSICPDIEYSTWSPKSFLRRSNDLEGSSSSSSDEEVEILTAFVQHIRNVRFPRRSPRRAGNGHYVDFNNLGPVDPQPSSAPIVHAQIIDIKPRRRRPSSTPTTAVLAHRKSVEEAEQESSPQTWEDAIAAADRRYEAEQETKDSSSGWEAAVAAARRFEMEDVWQRARTAVRGRRARGELPSPESPVIGGRLNILDDEESLSLDISPIPIDWNKAPRFATPSIHSHGSEFDDSSPLCGLPRKAKHRQTKQETPRQRLRALSMQMIQPDKASLRDRIVGWLRNIVSPGSETRTQSASSPRSFKVWNAPKAAEQPSKRHGRVFGSEDLGVHREHDRVSNKQWGRSGKAPSAKTALKDVTNLRQSGYLEHNSFFEGSKTPFPNDAPRTATQHAAGSTGETNEYSPESIFARAKWPNPFTQHPPSGDERTKTIRAQLENYPNEDSSPPHNSLPSTSSWAPYVTPPKRGGEAVIEDTLARLEGRVAPGPKSPLPAYLRSYARTQGLSLENTGEELQRQRKSSWSKVIQDWRATTGSVERRASMKPPVSAHSHHGLLDGPSHATPGRGHWFYDAEKIYGQQ